MIESAESVWHYRGRKLTRFHAGLDFHIKVLKGCFIQSIEKGDICSSKRCYNQLVRLHFKHEVAKDLLSFGVQLVELSEAEENKSFKTKELLQSLIALKGSNLTIHVRKLAEMLLIENKADEAIALIKSKLPNKSSRVLLDELSLR